jgi:hypothetical protein
MAKRFNPWSTRQVPLRTGITDYRAMGCSPVEINAINRTYEEEIETTQRRQSIPEYLVGEYIRRTSLSGKKPNPRILKELLKEED